MFAIVETGGKQYRVTPGDTFRVEKLPADRGTTVKLDRVLACSADEQLTVGTPLVDGAAVMCTVLEQDRAKKVMAIRFKSKKNVRVKRGHRQYFTRLRMDSITLPDGTVLGAATEEETPAVEAATPEVTASPAEATAPEETAAPEEAES